jgi:hypothetical protein
MAESNGHQWLWRRPVFNAFKRGRGLIEVKPNIAKEGE